MPNIGRLPVTNEERFFQLTSVGSIEKCWPWNGYKNKKGYGRFKVRMADGSYKTRYAYGYSYERIVGPIPVGKVLDHTCRPCHAIRLRNERLAAKILKGGG